MEDRRHRVVCVLADGMATSVGVAIANDFFGVPGTGEFLGVPWYRYTICTADRPPYGSTPWTSASGTASAPCPGPIP
ncbi:MAG: hypothetical protein ACRDN0_35450 [Trebonia sp.]